MGRKVFITGFGRFCGIEDNPTTHLVEWLAQSDQSDLLAGHAILTVAVSDVGQWFDENDSRLRDVNPLLLHLGVDGGSQEFALESTAYNTIDFPCPDERNFQPPEPTPIDPLVPLDSPLLTTCSDILSVQEHLTTLGLNCHVSTDPGRFLCNYIYYQALSRGYQALFCHVPPFSAISEIEQRDFLAHLISLLSAEKI